MKLSIKQQFKKDRDDLAKIYRKIRRDNPTMARLLYARMKGATKQLIEHLFYMPYELHPGAVVLLTDDNTEPSRAGKW